MVLTMCDISALVALHSPACPVQASAIQKKIAKETGAATTASTKKKNTKKTSKAMLAICFLLYACCWTSRGDNRASVLGMCLGDFCWVHNLVGS
jgi:hypothetical protein